MNSLWSETAKRPAFEALKQDIKTDVLIIGGGITGILCAHMLENAGVDYVVAEADRICGGITCNTTAKITFQHGFIYDRLIRTFGTDVAKGYLEANRIALEKYKTICKEAECDFSECDSFVYSVDNRSKIEKELTALERLGEEAEFKENLTLPFNIAGAVKVKNQAQFNPLKFAFTVSKKLNIFEKTKVRELTPGGVITNHGKIMADKIIVATHFPFINKHGGYFIKLYQHRSYVLALKNAANVNGMYVDEAQKGMSFRNYKDLLLLGGGGHRTGKKGGNWNELERFALQHYPQAKAVYRWATQDCMTLDGIPYIGRYSKNTPDMYVATGFNKWGMTSAMTAAMLLTDMLLDRDSPYVSVFSPSRSVLRSQLAVNTAESLLGLLTPVAPRCPHMGCALKYNSAEHTWDCPCHGSRFEKDGELIDNPATDDKKM